MKIIPSDSIELITPFSKSEVQKILHENIIPKRTLKNKLDKHKIDKPFEGEFSGKQFVIQRVINYKNSFLPQIKGIIIQEADGSKIKATLKIHRLVALFMYIWLIGVSFGGIMTVYAFLTKGANIMATIVFLPMLILGLILMNTAFNKEKETAIKKLTELLQARQQK